MIKTITAVAFVMTHVFVVGFWAGSAWKEKHIDGTVVRTTPQECAGKLAAELRKEREAEKDWKLPWLRLPLQRF